MILINSGRFRMGSPELDKEAATVERPQHVVAIVRPFAIARCETTVGEFRRFVEETRYVTDAEQFGGCYTHESTDRSAKQQPGTYWDAPGFSQSDTHPVVCVSNQDALAYASWMSLKTGAEYRLPTEAEWEYVARGGETRPYPWGDEASAG